MRLKKKLLRFVASINLNRQFITTYLRQWLQNYPDIRDFDYHCIIVALLIKKTSQ